MSPKGKPYEVTNIKEFAKEHSLNRDRLTAFVKGGPWQGRVEADLDGWTRAGKRADAPAAAQVASATPSNSYGHKNLFVQDPVGKIHSVQPSLTAFCDKHGLDPEEGGGDPQGPRGGVQGLEGRRGPGQLRRGAVAPDDAREDAREATREEAQEDVTATTSLVSSEGKRYEVTNIKEFAKEHSLNRDRLSAFLKGKPWQGRVEENLDGWKRGVPLETVKQMVAKVQQAAAGTAAGTAAGADQEATREFCLVSAEGEYQVVQTTDRQFASQLGLSKERLKAFLHRKPWKGSVEVEIKGWKVVEDDVIYMHAKDKQRVQALPKEERHETLKKRLAELQKDAAKRPEQQTARNAAESSGAAAAVVAAVAAGGPVAPAGTAVRAESCHTTTPSEHRQRFG